MLLQSICFVLFYSTFAQSIANNACNNYWSYLIIDFSDNCYFIPDANETVPEIIARHTGVGETHEVVTEDGYVLQLFRIPKKNPKGVVLLLHPFAVDSAIWVGQDNQSTAFLFWRAGYDVWLGNSRGNRYAHINLNNLTVEDPEFWNFTVHEMGIYDHPASIDYIYHLTGSRIVYVGHSMGTTSSLVYASLKPEHAKKRVKVFIELAPVGPVKYATSPAISYVAPYVNLIESFNNRIGWYSLANHNSWELMLGRILMVLFPFKIIVVYFICVFCGWTPDQYDPNFFNLMVLQFGSGVSWKVPYFLWQLYNAGGRFQFYDYGQRGNLELYGTENPPIYPLEKIDVPIYLWHALQDNIAQPQDVELLYHQLPDKAKIYGKVAIAGLNHLDFHYGKDRIVKVYDKILRFLDTI